MPILEDQLRVDLPPETLFGAVGDLSGRLDRILFVVSAAAPETTLEQIDPLAVADRMVASLGSSRPCQSRNSIRSRATSAASSEVARCAKRRKYPSPFMSLIEVPSGLEGVIAFDTSIAEPDKEGGALRYRGVDIEELVGKVPYEKVWGLLVDGRYEPGLPPAEPHPLA